MEDLFDKYKYVLKQALKEDAVGIYMVGSGAIPGMPGGPMIDIAVAAKNYPPTPEQMQKMKVEYNSRRYCSRSIVYVMV